jgi:AraC-like DNA-binding protein
VKLTLEQEPFLMVRSSAAGYFSGYVIAPHVHDWHQLLFASSGAMTVLGGRSSWMVPPSNAVFLPAGCAHSIRMWGLVKLRELILRIVEMAALDSREPAHRRLLDVLLDELHGAPVNPLVLPMPGDARAMAVAEHVLAHPSDGESLDSLARRFGAGRRTLERLFREETGISFGLWQQKARLLDSIRLLAEGKSVTEASLETGYASLSAFIAAFRRTFGYTPGKLPAAGAGS